MVQLLVLYVLKGFEPVFPGAILFKNVCFSQKPKCIQSHALGLLFYFVGDVLIP